MNYIQNPIDLRISSGEKRDVEKTLLEKLFQKCLPNFARP
jgi:hypothetical protein